MRYLVTFRDRTCRMILNIKSCQLKSVFTWIDNYGASHELKEVISAKRIAAPKGIINVTFPDGQVKQYESPQQFLIGNNFKKDPSLATIYNYVNRDLKIDNQTYHFSRVILEPETVKQQPIDTKPLPQAKPQDLGYMNSWRTMPIELVKCHKYNHTPRAETIRASVQQITCDRCNITYGVDSSD